MGLVYEQPVYTQLLKSYHIVFSPLGLQLFQSGFQRLSGRVAFRILERAICGEDPNGTDISILMTKQPVQQVGIVLFISCHLQNDVA